MKAYGFAAGGGKTEEAQNVTEAARKVNSGADCIVCILKFDERTPVRWTGFVESKQTDTKIPNETK